MKKDFSLPSVAARFEPRTSRASATGTPWLQRQTNQSLTETNLGQIEANGAFQLTASAAMSLENVSAGILKNWQTSAETRSHNFEWWPGKLFFFNVPTCEGN